MKKAAILMLMFILCFTSSASASGLEALFVDGLPVAVSGHVLSGGTYFMPVRPIAESLGLSARWDERLRAVYLEGGGKHIILFMTGLMRVNGTEYNLEKKPFLRQGQLFVPLRAFIEVLGGQVDYVGETEKIYVYMPNGTIRTIAGASPDIEAVIIRDETGLSVQMKSTSAQVLNALVIVTAGDQRTDFVSWVDKESGLALTVLQPGVTYNTSLQFPSWVKGVDSVEVVWVDSTRFRGTNPHGAQYLFSFVVSCRLPLILAPSSGLTEQ